MIGLIFRACIDRVFTSTIHGCKLQVKCQFQIKCSSINMSPYESVLSDQLKFEFGSKPEGPTSNCGFSRPRLLAEFVVQVPSLVSALTSLTA